VKNINTVIAESDEAQLFNQLRQTRFDLDDKIGKLAAVIILAKLDQYGVDEMDVDGDDELPSYAILPDSSDVPGPEGWDDGDELLNDVISWLPSRAFHNVRGRGGEPQQVRREDLQKLLRGDLL
jgi:hypothetical protein